MTKEIRIKNKTIEGWMGSEYDEVYVNIVDIFLEIWRQITPDQKQAIIQDMGADGDIRDRVVNTMSGDEVEWGHDMHGEKLLAKIETEATKNLRWNALGKAVKDLQRLYDYREARNDLYWELRHDETHGEWFSEWARKRGVKPSNEHKNLEKILTDTISELLKEEA